MSDKTFKQQVEPKCEAIHCDKPATETLVSSVFPSLTFNLCKEHAKSYLKTGGQPEAERQVSRNTIEHEAEMPLIELQKEVRATIQVCRDFDDCDEDTTKRVIATVQKWLPAHDSAVAAKAIAEFAEKCIKFIKDMGNPNKYDHSRRTEWDGYSDCRMDCIRGIRAMAGKK